MIIAVATRDRVCHYHSSPAIYPSLTASVATVTALLAVKHSPAGACIPFLRPVLHLFYRNGLAKLQTLSIFGNRSNGGSRGFKCGPLDL